MRAAPSNGARLTEPAREAAVDPHSAPMNSTVQPGRRLLIRVTLTAAARARELTARTADRFDTRNDFGTTPRMAA